MADLQQYQMLIGGQWVSAASGKTMPSLSPYTGEPWADVPEGAAADVEAAVDAAEEALLKGDWARMTGRERGELLWHFADVLAQHAEHLGQIETRDNGKLIREMVAQARTLPKIYRYFAGLADKIQGDVIPLDKPTMFNYTLREPVGVVGMQIPWNSPLLILTFALAPALAAGNTVVVKPSEHASCSTLEFARLFQEAGLPAGVLNVVTGYGPTVGASLSGHPKLGKLAFTGSPEAGAVVSKLAAENLTPVLLELGGKSPNMVFEDANLDNAMNGIIAGIFAASGQTCIAGSRALVHESIYQEMLDRLVERTKRIRLGDPTNWETEMGPAATPAQLDKIKTYVRVGQEEGARLAVGGRQPTGTAELEKGWFFEPTIFYDVRNEMRLAQEEIFGPVLGLIPFKDEEEAIAIANRTRFGLAAGVWTNSLARAHRVAQQVQAGTVWVNTYRSVHHASPFGGYKDSGHGRENGMEAIREFTQVKSVQIELSDQVPDPFVLRQ